MGELFSAFMAQCLYGPDGFYTASGRAGRRGDFLTSPEVGPLFGTVIAQMIDAEWAAHGRPEHFTVIDWGAGPGTLARSIEAAQPACKDALTYLAVECSPAQRASHPDWVTSLAELPTGPYTGVVIANELLDNLPFDLAVFDDGWRLAYVETQPDGRPVEHVGPVLDPLPDWLPSDAPLGARAPLQRAAHDWVLSATGALSAGLVIVFDYCTPTTTELAYRPWRDWLRTYRNHERGGHYLAAPGAQDITTQVAIDQLPAPTTVRSQQQWLRLHGIDELVDAGRVYWERHASQPDLVAIRMRSRITEADALLDPAGLGNFDVLEWRVEPEPPGI